MQWLLSWVCCAGGACARCGDDFPQRLYALSTFVIDFIPMVVLVFPSHGQEPRQDFAAFSLVVYGVVHCCALLSMCGVLARLSSWPGSLELGLRTRHWSRMRW